MNLTKEEEKMLSGAYGEAVKFAMQILTRMGEAYGAERMSTIESAHMAAVYPHLLASVELVERFANLGARVRIPTTINPSHQPHNFNRWKEFPEPIVLRENATRLRNAVDRLGVIPNYSCTPYFQGNLPRLGQNVSWIESSAICFANPALGARTNRTTMGVDIASAVAARVPEFGLLLDENRIGNVLVKMEFQPQTMFDYGTCGYLVGKLCSGKIPVIENMPRNTTLNHLKIFGAAAASEGGIALYHAVGITPEARTREEAFKGRKPEFDVKIGEQEVATAAANIGELSTFKGGEIDAVLMGCPHPRVEEMAEIAQYLQGRKVRSNIKFCIFASHDVVSWSRQMGYVGIIEGAGADILEGDCIVFYPTKAWGWKRVMTNSAKYAIILPSDPTWLDVWYAGTKECIEVATTAKRGGK
jgi:predicted aconitase